MPLIASDVVFRYPTLISNESSNGGVISARSVVNDAFENIFPITTPQMRSDGAVLYRKLFAHIASSTDDKALDMYIGLVQPSTGADRILLLPGTDNDTQADIVAAPPRNYGSGFLHVAAAAGSTSIVVRMESAADSSIQNGDVIRIGHFSYDPVTGVVNETLGETCVVTGLSTSSDDLTLTLQTPLENSYSPTQTLDADDRMVAFTTVSSLLPVGVDDGSNRILEAYADSVTVTGGAAFDPSAVLFNNLSTISEAVTLSFSNASTYTAVGSLSGNLGTGNIGSNFAPNNPNYASPAPYFTLPPSCFLGGSPSAGNQITFATHAPAAGVWLKSVLPAATALGATSVFALTVYWLNAK